MHNAIVTLVYYSVMQYTCSFFVLKHGLTTAHYCAIMFMFGQFKMHPNIAVIVTGLQSGWLRNHRPVSARNKEILLQNVLTLWNPSDLLLGNTCSFTGVKAGRASSAII